jgi:hypothetical protein
MDFFYLALAEEVKGPYTLTQIREFLTGADISRETAAWHQGSAEWVPLGYLLDRIDGVDLTDQASGFQLGGL